MDKLATPCGQTIGAKCCTSAACALLILVIGLGWPSQSIVSQPSAPGFRVNVPYWPAGAAYPSRSIFWLGQVTPTINSADVRMIYDDSYLKITVHIIDRRLWSDESPTSEDLTKWDAVTLYLDLDGAIDKPLDARTFRFDAQLGAQPDDPERQELYTGSGSRWLAAAVPISVTTSWRGNWPGDDIDDKGWQIDFYLPFTSFGLASPPPPATSWGVALAVHDRDDAAGAPIPDQRWPETLDPNQPATWGQLHFGLPDYTPPLAAPGELITVRHGLQGATVADAHVGGHATCGEGLDHWSEWGEANYAGYDQFNIQNQWDVSDYPCFSKYFVTFPLDALPTGQTIVSATVTLYLFGNAGYQPGEAKVSVIEALTVAADWDEATINWNNAPRALENISRTRVEPVDFFDPGVPYTWNVSRAVADAYTRNIPLRLAFYSADGEYHSGKYFWSSDAAESVRPTLRVQLGKPLTLTETLYAPLVVAQ